MATATLPVPETGAPGGPTTEDARRQKKLEEYRKKLIEHRELDSKLKKSIYTLLFYYRRLSPIYIYILLCGTVREDLKELSKEFEKSEDDLKSLQSGVGQIVGEVLRQLTEEKCMYMSITC